MKEILRLKQVRHSYNGRTVLTMPELRIMSGTITGLAGPNGSGKSTLLKIMALTERCSSGTVYFNGSAVAPFDKQVRHRLTLLPQAPYLLKRTVSDNISYGLKIRNRTEDITAAVHGALELVGLDASFSNRLWFELSGGEARRVALAARLALKPACLLLDEPTAGVDMESARSIRRAVLLARRDWGTTLVIASHHQFWLNDICEELIYLYNGRRLRGSFENILLGPWERTGEGLVRAQLADGQYVYAAPPQGRENAAVIDTGGFAPARPQKEPAARTIRELRGTVTGIFQDRLQDAPRIHVICGDHLFVVAASDQFLRDRELRPGQQVTLAYDPAAVSWLPA